MTRCYKRLSKMMAEGKLDQEAVDLIWPKSPRVQIALIRQIQHIVEHPSVSWASLTVLYIATRRGYLDLNMSGKYWRQSYLVDNLHYSLRNKITKRFAKEMDLAAKRNDPQAYQMVDAARLNFRDVVGRYS